MSDYLPIIKIYNAIKNDYKNVRLENGWIQIVLYNDYPEISLAIHPFDIGLRIGFNRLSIKYSDPSDIVAVQDDITKTIVFVRDFIENIVDILKEKKSIKF